MHLKAKAFAYWILGYQDFIEPIVRAWLDENGFVSMAQKRSVPALEIRGVLDRIQAKCHKLHLPENRLETAIQTLQKRTRLQLDILAKGESGLVTGEIKSWGGFTHSATWSKVQEIFVHTDHGLFLLLDEVQGIPVTASILVLWRRSSEHDLIEKNLATVFGRPFHLFYIDEILASNGPRTLNAVQERLGLLSDSVSVIKTMLSQRPSDSC